MDATFLKRAAIALRTFSPFGFLQLPTRLGLGVTITLCSLFGYAQASGERNVLFQSTEKQTTLVELFTSEGCSSCPPAEAWLGKLSTNPGLWREFVPIAFHVNYWDGLGWKDRFASPIFTQRQRAYAASWNGESVYTPGFVVNGREWNWFSEPRLPAATGASIGVLSVRQIADKRLGFSFAPLAASTFKWDLHVALLGSGIASKVARGENGGRELHHDFVVLNYELIPMTTDAGIARAEWALPSSQADKGTRTALATWVTVHDALVPIQATGGWLPPAIP
jgi:hypothetical protein